MKKILSFSILAITLFVLETMAQPLIYVSSGNRVKNKHPFAGGTSCCNCRVKHYGTLPDDFPTVDVKSVTFYLLNSRQNSYYTKVKAGPTTLKFMLGDQEAYATSLQKPNFDFIPVKHKWTLQFDFPTPVKAAPGTKWQLLDGDNNIYSAVMLHSSDDGQGGGLPGIDEQTGCQYTHRIESRYSVQFDVSGFTLPIDPGKLNIQGTITGTKRTLYKTAVVEFTERGNLDVQDAGSIIAEWITTALNKTGAFEVYERLSLEKLMEEHKMGMSGLLDESTIAQIGKMRGVQAIVTGSVLKFGDIVSVTAKLIDTETAQIIDSGVIKATNLNTISFEIDKLAMELAMTN